MVNNDDAFFEQKQEKQMIGKWFVMVHRLDVCQAYLRFQKNRQLCYIAVNFGGSFSRKIRHLLLKAWFSQCRSHQKLGLLVSKLGQGIFHVNTAKEPTATSHQT